MEKTIKLGLGLIGIGRPWGHANAVVPSQEAALDLLDFAYKLGIRYFDTAPSYGKSEERLGMFLASLSSEQRKSVTVATKFGEHWNKEKEEPYVDQSFEGLKRSLDQSLSYLKKIDILYLHKTNLDTLQSEDVQKAFTYARTLGIKRFGASVSDTESGEYVCNNPLYSAMQFPYNLSNNKFSDIIELAKQNNKTIVINRPFSMGDLLYSDEYKNMSADDLKEKAYRFILVKKFDGYILTGTKSKEHLKENYALFSKIKSETV